ncbi:MAG: hypothetical protein ACYC91_05490 [Solirubrobacteraceae bacterium]
MSIRAIRRLPASTVVILVLGAVTFGGIALAGVALTGCGRAASSAAAPLSSTLARSGDGAVLHGHPQAIEPMIGALPRGGEAPGAPAQVSVSSGADATGTGALPQPVSDAQVRRELAASGQSANPDQGTLTPGGLAIAPIDAPQAVQALITAGNAIARLPYRFGGGHGTFEDSAYDCSGSLSFVFAAAGLLNTTLTSGQLMSWGNAGPGRWITVFAAPGHTFMYVAGLRFDTVALAETGSRWSERSADEPDLRTFVVRHPPGL